MAIEEGSVVWESDANKEKGDEILSKLNGLSESLVSLQDQVNEINRRLVSLYQEVKSTREEHNAQINRLKGDLTLIREQINSVENFVRRHVELIETQRRYGIRTPIPRGLSPGQQRSIGIGGFDVE